MKFHMYTAYIRMLNYVTNAGVLAPSGKLYVFRAE